jgi:homocysteine S-methyltransferase
MPPSPSEPQILLLDGGLGTLLADQFAVKFDDSTPLWSSQLLLSSPSTLLSAQKAFAQAGADILLTACKKMKRGRR